MSKSASGRLSASLLIKKTPESTDLPVGKAQLQAGYEELRAYALSMVKAPSRPLGLDMWNKKGFLRWAAASYHRAPPVPPAKRSASDPLDVPIALVISLANIINDWSERYGRPDDEWENQT